jgi:hypothetical protein
MAASHSPTAWLPRTTNANLSSLLSIHVVSSLVCHHGFQSYSPLVEHWLNEVQSRSCRTCVNLLPSRPRPWWLDLPFALLHMPRTRCQVVRVSQNKQDIKPL